MSRTVRWILIAPVAALALLQLVPFGRDHTNPPVVREPEWDSPRTRELVRRACYDCHSNESRWPWYAHVAPASWLVQHDVEEAREHLNFSEWHLPQRHQFEAVEMVEEGEMPLWYYALMHPSARLDEAETKALIDGFKATLGSED
ncbi:MAG TPA: heme-binding domain-containing protein [Planctomycetota bacterium]|nr:heme-binding domain-containing protein [Planctomycetota bacterium]